MKKLICAIDIGSSKIKILVCQKKKGILEAVFKDEVISAGVKKGIITDPEKVSKILKNLIEKAEKNLKSKINSAFLNLGGTHLFSTISRNLVSVSRADLIISEEDVERVLKEAKTMGIGQNKEVFETIPLDFIVNGEKGIKEPIGLRGTKLEVEALLLGCFSPYLEKIKDTAFRADLEILELIPSPLAVAKATLTEKQKENGVCLLDIGGETTSLAIFNEGNLIHLSVLPVGSQAITNEIAIEFKIGPEVAERIKIEFGTLFFKGKNLRQKVDLGEEEPLVFSQRGLTKLIQQKFSEIFFEVKKELKRIQKERKLPSGVILTGGGAKIPKLVRFAREKFHLYCQLGKPRGIVGLEEDPSLSVITGLILVGSELEEKEIAERKGIFSKIKGFFRIFIP